MPFKEPINREEVFCRNLVTSVVVFPISALIRTTFTLWYEQSNLILSSMCSSTLLLLITMAILCAPCNVNQSTTSTHSSNSEPDKMQEKYNHSSSFK